MANNTLKAQARRSLLTVAAVLAALLLLPRGSTAQLCGGDCNADGMVAMNELIIGVNIASGSAALASCAAMDLDSSNAVEIQDLVGAVLHALNDCPVPTCPVPEGGRCIEIGPGPDAQDAILTALLEAQPKDVIFLKAGRYDLDSQLSLTVDDVTLRGEGMDSTILSFKGQAGQTGNAEGLLVRASHFTLENIGLEDAPGDLFKIEGCDGVTVRHARAEWTDGPKTSNGSYGFYPVQCRDVLIEDSVVIGAADAGIYVGQSRNIIVRRNRVELNVAGIEIENSTDADVHDNVATHNTGGILVFNLPGPQVQDGRRTRLYDNQIYENNTTNFGAPGSSVSAVPTGTGTMILSNDLVEIFGNTFRDNDATHIILISYNTGEMFGAQQSTNPDHDPYTESIFVHDNTFEGGGENPPEDLGLLVTINGGLPLPNILYDGDVDASHLVGGQLPAHLRTCIQQPGATYIDLDVSHQFAGLNHDLEGVNCTLDPLPGITIGDGRHIEISPGPDAQEQLLTALIEALPGDDILVKAGTYDLTEALSVTVDHVTLRGEGMDETVLRFDGLTQAGEGLLVRANDFTLEDIGLEDGPGDLFKAEGADGLRLRRCRAEWTAGPLSTNGSYGLYPVQSKDVLIEDCVVKGASDAGIYVGQSRNIIIRRNEVEFNVAGIEIENSTSADVYENTATHNTGGILVFNLPGLQVFGARTRVYDNHSVDNNTPNFAPAGNIVGAVPSGTGMMILANDQVEVFGNTFQDNNTTHILNVSYDTAEFFGTAPAHDPNFDPYSESIHILDNTYVGGGTEPDLPELVVQFAGGLPIPNLTLDGDENPSNLVDGALPAELRTCVREDATTTLVDLDVGGGFVNISHDPARFDCTLARLTPVAMAGVGQ
jgi:parallel beta-helix repeat protein